MAANCDWNEWVAKSKIFFAAWIESVTTTIFEIPGKLMAWLMPHLMAKSSASVEVTLVAWWIVLMTGLSWTWIYAMEVVTLFLIPISKMMRVCEWFNEYVIAMSLSLLEQSSRLLSLCLKTGWNKKQLVKISIRHEPGENFWI